MVETNSRGQGAVDQAVILAAGKGERLYPLTTLQPKVMLPIGNKPILQYVVEALAANGVPEIIIVVGYHREQIQDYFGSGDQFDIRIRYAVQEHQLGTGHALMCAKELIKGRFLVLPGDNILNPLAIQDLIKSGGLDEAFGKQLDPQSTHVYLSGNPAMIGLPKWDGDTPRYPEVEGVFEVLAARGFTADRRGAPGNVHYEEYW